MMRAACFGSDIFHFVLKESIHSCLTGLGIPSWQTEHSQQAVENGEQLCEGTHRFAEPVSNTTLNI